jgi:hypothetical protein
MVITVGMVRKMEMPIDQEIYMIAMRDGFMATRWPVDMSEFMTMARMIGGTVLRVGLRYFNDMFVDMVVMDMVHVSIMKIICMPLVFHRGMATSRAV